MEHPLGGYVTVRTVADLVFAGAVVAAVDYTILGSLSYHVHDLMGFDLGYFVFTFFILSLFLVVYEHSWPMIKRSWREKWPRRVSWLAGIGFATFYVFVTNTVSAPDPGDPPPLPFGFLAVSRVYGPMATWPDIEFWSPRAGLFGYFSIGTVLLIISLGLLTSFAVALLIQSIGLRGERKPGKGVSGSLGGAFIISLSTNACCCCTPVMLPLIAALAGETTAGSLQYSLLIPGSPYTDLLAIVNPVLLLLSILISTRRNRDCRVAEH